MVRFILVFFLSMHAYADFLGFSAKPFKSRIPEIVTRLKSIEVEDGSLYEEKFNQLVKMVENSVEEEKLFCSGEAADSEGKVLPKESKQLCFRELKGHYLDAMETVFNLKKKYLQLIHNRQIEKLTEIQKKLKADIDKSF